MVKVYLHSEKKELDIIDGKITYVKQVGDLGDITSINTSYSWSMKFPKTPRNTKIFKGLGIVGNISNKPYQKIKVSILDNGIEIVSGGLLQIISTNDTEYKGVIQDGIIDFYKDIENDKITPTIDLTDLTHENTAQNIFDSWDMILPYKYIVANYNGAILPDIDGTTNLDRNALVPSINVKYLFDKIMSHYGWTYSGIDASNDWMTYPKALSKDTSSSPIVADLIPEEIYQKAHGFQTIIDFTVSGIDNSFVTVIGNSTLDIQQLTTYALEVPAANNSQFNLQTSVYINNQFVRGGSGAYEADLNTLQVDDKVTVRVKVESFQQNIYGDVFWEGNLFLKATGGTTVNFSKALVKLEVKYFFKEIMMQNALTAFADSENKHIDFLNIDERINAEIIDWTKKYVKRKDEKYVYKTYAQNNLMKHQYDEEGSDYSDGNITVSNVNLDIEKELYASKTYAPMEGFVTYHDGLTLTPEIINYTVSILKMFDIQIKEEENDSGVVERVIDYQPLEDRFYFMTHKNESHVIYVNGNLFHTLPVPIPIGIPKTWDKIVGEKYPEIQSILNTTIIHNIDLILDVIDISHLDLSKLYSFEQENSIYILNKLTWNSGKICTGEFIRVTQ